MPLVSFLLETLCSSICFLAPHSFVCTCPDDKNIGRSCFGRWKERWPNNEKYKGKKKVL